eukprot:8871408-Pyramimonas_sp.AAC.1
MATPKKIAHVRAMPCNPLPSSSILPPPLSFLLSRSVPRLPPLLPHPPDLLTPHLSPFPWWQRKAGRHGSMPPTMVS